MPRPTTGHSFLLSLIRPMLVLFWKRERPTSSAAFLRYHLSMRRFALLLLVSISAMAQVHPAKDGDLSLLIIPNTSFVHSKDTLLMKVEVMNIGRDPIYLRTDDLCLNPGAGLTLQVSDSSGHALKTSVPLTCVSVPETVDRDSLVRLAPDAFYGLLIRVQPNRISPKPGRFLLNFSLRGTLSRQQCAQILRVDKTPAIAFTSDSSSLKFQVALEIAP
jgi:hypothetical protein